MPAHPHRTTVPASDARASAELVGRILGLSPAAPPAPEGRLQAANDVTLEFTTTTAITPQRYAFVVTENEFDAVYARLLDLPAHTWADPERTRPAGIDHPPGGRGICFEDPDGHLVEILTNLGDEGHRGPAPTRLATPFASHQPLGRCSLPMLRRRSPARPRGSAPRHHHRRIR